MNWDRVKEAADGQVMEPWGELTDDSPGKPPAACVQFLRGAHLPSPGRFRLGTPDVSDVGAYRFTIATTC
jgi:hypothetical protein